MWSLTNYAVCGLAVTAVITTAGWNVTANKLEKEQEAHKKTKANHELVVNQFEAAQQEADRKAKETAERIRKEAEQNAKQADVRYADLYHKYRANLVRYQQANPGSGTGTGGGSGKAPEGAARPSGGSEVPSGLTISFEDAEVCAVNTARLIAGHEWAIQYK